MLSADIQVLDFTAQDWLRLADLFRKPGAPAAPAGASGALLGVRSGERLIKLMSTRRGRLPLPEPGTPAATSLAALGSAHGASFVLVFSSVALEQLNDRFSRRLAPDQSFHQQLEAFVAGLRELEQEGELSLWPSRFSDWPVPTERAATAALDLVCPDGKALVLGAFHQGALYTSIALRRRGAAIDLALGPDRLRHDMGLLSGDFSRDYRYLGAAVESRLGPIAVGCYAELETFQGLSAASEPGAWASAVAARDVVLTPVTRGVALPLGVDAGRAALAFAKGLASRFGALEGLSRAPLAPALGRAYAFVEGDVRRYLGFDPWRLLSGWFRMGA